MNDNKKSDRRDFLKGFGLGAAALATTAITSEAQAKSPNQLKGKKMAMLIDLHRCTGCGGCLITCKNENNVQDGISWSKFIAKTEGKFPNVRYIYQPTLCNHCDNAPCVKTCPVSAMYKGDGDITAHDPNKCIGCKSCMAVCPYDVISLNQENPQKFWRDSKEIIQGCTDSPQKVVSKAKTVNTPYYNPDREANHKGSGVRMKGVVEKCTLCDHRLKQGENPYCVDRCPANARIIGDLNDPNSSINKILGKYQPTLLKEELGTKPKVLYVRDFNFARYEGTKGEI